MPPEGDPPVSSPVPPPHLHFGLFLYGTLMRGRSNHHVVEALVDHGHASFVGRAQSRKPLVMVDLGPYPALLREGEGGVIVHGELWKVDAVALAELDRFEGCPELYARVAIPVACEGADADAYTYVLATPAPRHARRIQSGIYEATGTALPEGASADQFEDNQG